MIMTHREHIPFFSELPEKAIKVATVLWDAVQKPSYNGVQAYNDFAQDLGFFGIAAPPRAIVKRWVAGVQAGLIPRPLPLPDPDPVPHGIAAAVATKGKPGRKPRQVTTEVEGMPAPAPEEGRPECLDEPVIMNALAGDAASEMAVRPVFSGSMDPETGKIAVSQIAIGDTVLPLAPQAGFEKLTPDAFARASYSTLIEAGITPADPNGEEPDPTLVIVAQQMIEEEVARINLGIRKMAKANVAARLRFMAVAIETNSL